MPWLDLRTLSGDLPQWVALGAQPNLHTLTVSLGLFQESGIESYCCLLMVQGPHYLLLVRPALERVTAVAHGLG